MFSIFTEDTVLHFVLSEVRFETTARTPLNLEIKKYEKLFDYDFNGLD